MKNDKPPKSMNFLPKQQSVLIAQEESILDLALKHNIEINHSCGGMGSCGTCRIWFESDHYKSIALNELEREMKIDRNMSDQERLSCQVKPENGMVVRVPESKI